MSSYSIGIPKIFNIGGLLGSEGLDLSVLLGIEDFVESHLNINFDSESLVEIDAKMEAGWNGKMIGAGASVGLHPNSYTKTYVLTDMLDDYGVNTYQEMGFEVKTIVIYAVLSLLFGKVPMGLKLVKECL